MKFAQSSATAWAGCDTRININGGQTVKFTADILTNCQLWIGLYQFNPNPHDLTNIYVPATNQETPITLSGALPDELTTLSLRFLQVNASTENIT